MKTIWKFILSPHGFVDIPEGAKLLTVAAQGNNICLWAEVNSEAEQETRLFNIYGTGHEMNSENEDELYIGTAFLDSLVFHVYEDISYGLQDKNFPNKTC